MEDVDYGRSNVANPNACTPAIGRISTDMTKLFVDQLLLKSE